VSDIYPQISHLLPFPRSATITKPFAPFCRLFVATARSRGSIFREFVDTSSSSRKPSSSARSSLNSLRAESHHRRSGDQISKFGNFAFLSSYRCSRTSLRELGSIFILRNKGCVLIPEIPLVCVKGGRELEPCITFVGLNYLLVSLNSFSYLTYFSLQSPEENIFTSDGLLSAVCFDANAGTQQTAAISISTKDKNHAAFLLRYSPLIGSTRPTP